MNVLKYKTFPKHVLKNVGLSKGELVKWMGIENVTFDPAVPQDWLNAFVADHGLDYSDFLSTIIYVYPDNLPSGIISGCTEYDNLLGNYSGRYDGKWERKDHNKAPDELIEREWDVLHNRMKAAIGIYYRKTGDTIKRMDVNWHPDGKFDIGNLY